MKCLARAITRLPYVLVASMLAVPAGLLPSAADVLKPNFTVTGIQGPNAVRVGLSATYTVTVRNIGNKTGYLELFVIFAGKLDQTGQVRAGGAFACEIRHDAGINAAVRCTGGQLAPNEEATFVVQGRGGSAGKGTLLATINPGQSIPEHDHGDNVRQFDVAIQ